MNPIPLLFWGLILTLHFLKYRQRLELPSGNEFEAISLTENFLLSKHEVYLRKLCFYLPRGQFKRKRGSITFRCRYHSRDLEIEYRYARTQSRLPELELKLPVVQKLWLRIVPQAGPPDEAE